MGFRCNAQRVTGGPAANVTGLLSLGVRALVEHSLNFYDVSGSVAEDVWVALRVTPITRLAMAFLGGRCPPVAGVHRFDRVEDENGGPFFGIKEWSPGEHK